MVRFLVRYNLKSIQPHETSPTYASPKEGNSPRFTFASVHPRSHPNCLTSHCYSPRPKRKERLPQRQREMGSRCPKQKGSVQGCTGTVVFGSVWTTKRVARFAFVMPQRLVHKHTSAAPGTGHLQVTFVLLGQLQQRRPSTSELEDSSKKRNRIPGQLHTPAEYLTKTCTN